MLIHNINPDIIRLGPLALRLYNMVYMVGYILVGYLLSKSKDKKISKKAYDITTVGLIAGIVGARIHHVITDFHLYQNNIIDVFAIWKGGLGFQGGLIAGIVALYLYCRKYKIELFKVFDTTAVPLPLILAFGRIANFINSEHVGFPTNLPWCVVFQKVDEVCRHPAQIYQAIAQFMLFGILFMLNKTKFGKRKGNLFYMFLFGYGLVRLMTDFFRPDLVIRTISYTQIIAMMMILVSIYFIYKNWVKK